MAPSTSSCKVELRAYNSTPQVTPTPHPTPRRPHDPAVLAARVDGSPAKFAGHMHFLGPNLHILSFLPTGLEPVGLEVSLYNGGFRSPTGDGSRLTLHGRAKLRNAELTRGERDHPLACDEASGHGRYTHVPGYETNVRHGRHASGPLSDKRKEEKRQLFSPHAARMQ